MSTARCRHAFSLDPPRSPAAAPRAAASERAATTGGQPAATDVDRRASVTVAVQRTVRSAYDAAAAVELESSTTDRLRPTDTSHHPARTANSNSLPVDTESLAGIRST